MPLPVDYIAETPDSVSEFEVEAAWSEEIKRRLAEIDAGAVDLIPWEDVRAELFAEPNERLDFTRKLAVNSSKRISFRRLRSSGCANNDIMSTCILYSSNISILFWGA